MTEQELIKLDFERVDVSPEEAGDENGFHYYTYNLSDSRGLCLISSSNDEAKTEGQWVVQIFDYDDISFTDAIELLSFINIVKKNITITVKELYSLDDAATMVQPVLEIISSTTYDTTGKQTSHTQYSKTNKDE